MQVQFLESTELISVCNVVSVVCQERGKFNWEASDGYQVFSKASDEHPQEIYYIFDTHNQNAFAHWVFENFVYLHYFFEIKKQFPTAKLVIYEKKDYKTLFLENNGVKKDDILTAEDIDFQYQTLNKNPIEQRLSKANLVFFHPYASLNSNKTEPYHRFAIQSYLESIQALPKEKTIPILYLPRGEKENFAGLDRRYVIQPQCKELVKELGGVIFETDTNTDYWKQIQLVRSAKIILCDYGSNLWVNGFFSEDAHILFLNIGWRQEHTLPYYGFLYSIIHDKNKSMTNIFPIGSNDTSKPTLVYHSFEQVRDCILHYLKE